MLRAVRQVGQVLLLSWGVSTALLMFAQCLKARQPASLASWHLRRISGYAPEGPPAFVFDIDGVLIQGGTVLPEAKKALARLYTNNGVRGLAQNAEPGCSSEQTVVLESMQQSVTYVGSLMQTTIHSCITDSYLSFKHLSCS